MYWKEDINRARAALICLSEVFKIAIYLHTMGKKMNFHNVCFFIGFRFNDGVWRGNFSKAIITDYTDPCRAFRACFGIF